ncbi:MAG TPA: FlgD immunoglobulin-like domain containing protein, partial [Candidatus Cloacimonadota bacterium]|nr:FlgD immunoglobulin-like domain containing protein [Candidatus Cloacimonadota bacterium]
TQSIEYACFMGGWNRSGNIYQATPNADPSTPEVQTELVGNYPNPFNPETTIRFSLQNAGTVSLNVYNARGQLVRSLVNNQMASGAHSVVWNGLDDSGRGVSSGIYYYRMQAGNFNQTRKMVLVK